MRLYKTTRYDRSVLTESWNAYHKGALEHFKGRETTLLVVDITDELDSRTVCDFLRIEHTGVDVETICNARRSASLLDRAKYSIR